MNKIFIILFLIFITSAPGFAKSKEKLDINSDSFMDLGRFIETLEINDERPIPQELVTQNEDFEEKAIIDVAKRYEDHSVELCLDEIDDDALTDINSNRLFKLSINETQYNIERNIKNENMIWDNSKSYTSAIFSSSRHMAPIPGVINSQSINAQISPILKASYGQTYLNDSLGTSVLFVRSNESTYNTGSVISYKGDSLNLSAGSFSSSYNHAASGGAILTSRSINLPKNTGSFLLGGAVYSKEEQQTEKTTGGGFVEYSYGRLKISAQVGQSRYSNSSVAETGLYFTPELRISDSLYLKTRLIRNLTLNTMQDELALSYKPKRSKSNFEFEINASNHYTQNSAIKQRIKLSTSFRI